MLTIFIFLLVSPLKKQFDFIIAYFYSFAIFQRVVQMYLTSFGSFLQIPFSLTGTETGHQQAAVDPDRWKNETVEILSKIKRKTTAPDRRHLRRTPIPLIWTESDRDHRPCPASLYQLAAAKRGAEISTKKVPNEINNVYFYYEVLILTLTHFEPICGYYLFFHR